VYVRERKREIELYRDIVCVRERGGERVQKRECERKAEGERKREREGERERECVCV